MKTANALILAIFSTGCYEIGVKATECEAQLQEMASKDGDNDESEDGNNGIGNDDEEAEAATDEGTTEAVADGSEESHLNGSRLKRRGFEGADGSYQFVGWYDTALEQDCTFKTTEGGGFHCIANVPTATYPWHYGNSDCTTRIAENHNGIGSATQIQATRVDYDNNNVTVHANFDIIGEIEVTTVYTLTSGGECVDSGYGSMGLYGWLEIEEVANSAYVAATEVID